MSALLLMAVCSAFSQKRSQVEKDPLEIIKFISNATV